MTLSLGKQKMKGRAVKDRGSGTGRKDPRKPGKIAGKGQPFLRDGRKSRVSGTTERLGEKEKKGG